MIVEVHVAYLVASLSVLFGVTYTLGMFLDKQTKRVLEQRAATGTEEIEAVALEA